MRFMAATVGRRRPMRIGDFPTCLPDGRKHDRPASDSAVTVLSNVIGRTAELAAIDDFLDSLEDGPAALVLEGDRGIGKTTLVRAAVEAAHRRDAQVLWCAASESHPRLSYAALGDLLAQIDNDVVGALPPPQRDASSPSGYIA